MGTKKSTRRTPKTPLNEDDERLFREGNHHRLYDVLGAHPGTVKRRPGVTFAVWAPAAAKVSVVGEFNAWNPETHPLSSAGASDVWSGFIEGVEHGALYKYHIESRLGGYTVDKADPFAFQAEARPGTAS